MKVKGWLIVGPMPSRGMLMPVEPSHDFHVIPDATTYPVGAIIEWIPVGSTRIVLVCVEIPL